MSGRACVGKAWAEATSSVRSRGAVGSNSLVLRSVAEATAVSTADEALTALEQGHFDVALVDLHLEAMAGESLLRELAQRWPATRRVAFTASP